jgi:SPP1 gp7 family putative phage head morphogenesis protein
VAGPSASQLLATGVARDIQDLDAAALKALQPVLAHAQAELAKDLQAWVAKLGPNAAEQKYTAAQVKQAHILLGIAQEQAKNPKASFPAVVGHAMAGILKTSGATHAALATLNAQLDQLRAKFADLSAPNLTHAAWFARGDKLVLDKHAKSAARYAGQVKDDLKMQFGIGLAKGETLAQLVKRVSNVSSFRQAVDASNPTKAGAAMAAGLAKRYGYWAERLARTELVNAYNYAAVEGIKQAHVLDDRISMRWDASLDMRVCPLCKSLHDKRVKPGEDFPGGYAHPPAHPQCRCSVVAWIEEDWAAGAAAAPEVTMTAEEAAKKDAIAKTKATKAANAAKKQAAAEVAAKVAAEEAASKAAAEAEAKKQAAIKAAEQAKFLAPTPVTSSVAFAQLDGSTTIIPPLSTDSPFIGPNATPLGWKSKGDTYLTGKGLAKVSDDVFAGHGYVFEWQGSGTGWVASQTPQASGYTIKSGAWSKSIPVPPLPTPPPVHVPAPAPSPAPSAPLGPKPGDIAGHEWKSTPAGWTLYKGDVPAASLVPGYNPATAPALSATYSYATPLIEKGLVTVGDGVIAGHGYVYVKQPDGSWVQTKAAGRAVAAPLPSTPSQHAPTLAHSQPPTAPPLAPLRTWTPNAIELAANRRNVVDFTAHPSSHYAGMHGAGFSADGDAVEGGSVRVVKVRGADGSDYYEAVFKVTHPYGDRTRQFASGQGQWYFRQRSLTSGVLTDNGHEVAQTRKSHVATGDGYHMEIGGDGAVRNAVRVRAKSLAALNGAVDDLGRHLGVDVRREVTDEDLRLQAKARLFAKLNPAGYAQGMRGVVTGPSRSLRPGGPPDDHRRMIEDGWAAVVRDHPWAQKALDDARVVEVYPGRKTLYSPSLGQRMGGEFGHMEHVGDAPPDIAASIISDTGLMSSHKRYNSGVFTQGMSTGEDFNTGGADGVFMRLRDKSHASSGSYNMTLEIDTAKVMGRLDWWAFNSDQYGAAGYTEYPGRWSAGDMRRGRAGHSNEVMAPDGVPPSAIRRMLCRSEEYRDRVLASLRARGVTKINGRLIEDVVVYAP